MVFIDESGLLLLPVGRRAWAPRGRTPVLWHIGRHRRKVSVIAALCVSPERRAVRLYFQLLVEKNFNAEANPPPAFLHRPQPALFMPHIGHY